MRPWLFAAVLALLPASALATTLPIQGALRSTVGGPVADGKYVMVFRIYEAIDAVDAAWEAVIDVDVAFGGFAIELGAGAKPIADNLLTAGKPLWVGVKVGTDPELPRGAIARVPSAHHATRAALADTASALACSACVGADQIADAAVTNQKVAFTFAGSESKGGAATSALTALKADWAATADAAQTAQTAVIAEKAAAAQTAVAADTAKMADKATTADSAATADSAKALACTGCVTAEHLDFAVATAAALDDHKTSADHDARYLKKTGDTVAGSLAVEGVLVLGAGACDAASEGALQYNKLIKAIEFCDGAAWQAVQAFKPAAFFLHAENDIIDAIGNVTFQSTAALIFSGKASKGANSFSTDVYSGSFADAALVTVDANKLWTLGGNSGDFVFEWDYRHTGDTGYAAVLFSNTLAWADSTSKYISQQENQVVKLPSGWMISMYWGGTRFFFNTSAGIVSWSYPGYHASWRHLKFTRTGATLEFFIDGASQGTKPAPNITESAPSQLYIAGSTNGGASGYGKGSYSLNFQMDEVKVSVTK